MANSLLEALQATQYQAGEDPFGIAAMGVGSVAPHLYNPYNSTGKNLAMGIGSGLLAGLLGGIAKHNAIQDNATLNTQIGPFLAAPPDTRAQLVQQEPRLSPLLAALQANEFENQQKLNYVQQEMAVKAPLELQQEIEKQISGELLKEGKAYLNGKVVDIGSLGIRTEDQRELDKAKSMIPIKVEETEAVDRIKREAEEKAYGGSLDKEESSGIFDGLNSLLGLKKPGVTKLPAKELRTLEQETTNKLLTGKMAEQALNINRAAANISDAIRYENPLAAATAIFEFAKLQDPAGTVRESDEMRVADPGGPLGQLAQIHNELMSKGKLTKEAKSAMAAIVPQLVANTFSSYDQVRKGFVDQASSVGADTNNIKYIKPYAFPEFKVNERLITAPDGTQVLIVD